LAEKVDFFKCFQYPEPQAATAGDLTIASTHTAAHSATFAKLVKTGQRLGKP
jgi:hypothetical protein